MEVEQDRNPIVAKHRAKRRRIELLSERVRLDSGPEREIAQRMLAKHRAAEVEAPPDARLAVIAEDIRTAWGKGIEAQFETGRHLEAAAAIFEAASGGLNRQAYGAWLSEQEFPFGRHTALWLRHAYRREGEVRQLLLTRGVATGAREPSVAAVVRLLDAKPKPDKVREQALRDVQEAWHSEDDPPQFVAWAAASQAMIEGDRLPGDILARVGPVIRALADWYTKQREAIQ